MFTKETKLTAADDLVCGKQILADYTCSKCVLTWKLGILSESAKFI
jgi:hypothetical protein